MQRSSRSTSTRLQSRRKRARGAEVVDSEVLSDGELAAKTFKWWRSWQNPYRTSPIPFKLVSGKKLYKANKDAFDKFAADAKRCGFDIKDYFRFCVIDRGMKETSIESCLKSTTMIDEYCMHVKKQKKLADIYKWFMTSVKNITDECIKTQTYTTKDFLRELVDKGKVGTYVAAGKISVYWLAAIPSFSKVIDHLDYFSQQELCLLKEHFDIYHSEVNEAFLAKKHKMVNPIELTDLAILKTLKKI